MMSRYPRLPAVLVLAVAIALSAAYVSAMQRRVARTTKVRSLEVLEKVIARPDATAADWSEYGQKVMARKEYTKAAMAFRNAMNKADAPKAKEQARLDCAIALAHSNGDEFYEFVHDMVNSDPGLTKTILEQPDSLPYLKQPRFAALLQDAKAQILD